MTKKDVPRRYQVELMSPPELAIRSAIMIVEELLPDTRLAEVVNLLQQALEKVADYVDDVLDGG